MRHTRWPGGLVAMTAALTWFGAAQATAQTQSVLQARMPIFPRDGFWAEVITVSNTWLVVQNQSGQQFPIAIEAVAGRRYVMRAPIPLNQVPARAVAEAIGMGMPNNGIQTAQLDIYDANLSQAARLGVESISATGRVSNVFMTNFAFASGFIFPDTVADLAGPSLTRAVGEVTSLNPLTLTMPGNQTYVIRPSGPLLITRLSLIAGDFRQIRRGDLVLVRLDPRAPALPKSLNVQQLIVYRGLR